MNLPRSLCVYCGASNGRHPSYAELARAFGHTLAEREITLVYGGGKVGLMGVLADATLAAGGTVIGVIPRQLLEKEVAHTGLTEMHVVETMHQRKTLMYQLAQAFVALPGGFGTLDEIFEMLTWSQLGLHDWPCAFLDTQDYYSRLRQTMAHMVGEGFVRENLFEGIWFGTDIDALFHWMIHRQPPANPRWLDAAAVAS